MAPNMKAMDPRIAQWTALREEAMEAFLKEVLSKHPEEGKVIQEHHLRRQKSAFSTSGSPPQTWEELTRAKARDNAALRAALRAAGAVDAWNKLGNLGWDSDIAALSPGLSITEHSAVGIDGNSIPLQLIRPEGTEVLPCVYYIHGGAMAYLSSRDGIFQSFGRLIARQGVAVCFVEFRNAVEGTALISEVAQFPKGLEDCYSGLHWLHSNKERLNLGDVLVAGESGGGNLSIAVALKAKAAGELHLIRAGVFALCPFIAGIWADAVDVGILGKSHIENGPLHLHTGLIYSQAALDRRDPLAWPGFALVEDLRGLPRMVISVNEGDMFRDEGVNFYRRCLLAGVPVQCRTVNGTLHASDLHFHELPDVACATAQAIADFAAGGAALLRRLPPPAPAPLPRSRL